MFACIEIMISMILTTMYEYYVVGSVVLIKAALIECDHKYKVM